MKILVTGGAGYIGAITVDQLIAKGHTVHVLDNLTTGHHQAIHKQATFHYADLGDTTAVKKTLSRSFPDAVLHLANKQDIAQSCKAPRTAFDNNFTYGKNLLDICLEYDVKKFVYASSSDVYSPSLSPAQAITTASPTSCTSSPYAASVLAFEALLQAYGKGYGIDFNILRYFPVAGASDSKGENHVQEHHTIPLLLQQLIKQKKPELKLPDYNKLFNSVSYVHVLDVAEANAYYLCKENKDSAHSIVNVASNRAYTVHDLCMICKQVIGISAKNMDQYLKSNGQYDLLCDTSSAKYSCNRSIQEIIDSAWQWLSYSTRTSTPV